MAKNNINDLALAGIFDFSSDAAVTVLASSATITPSAHGVVLRAAPTAAITGLIMAAGEEGEAQAIRNETAFTMQFATQATSKVRGVDFRTIGPHSVAILLYDVSDALWDMIGNVPTRTLLSMSATSPDIAGNGTITKSAEVMRFTPAAARTGIILAAGVLTGEEVIVRNDAAAANSLTFAAAPGGGVANGATTVIAGLSSRKFVWDGTIWSCESPT